MARTASTPTRTPTRRGPGGRGAGLTRERIVEQAVALMDRDGTDALTLRALARELGVEPPALYWHFAGKDDLCRAVVDSVAEQLRVSTSSRGTPRRRIEHHFRAIRDHWRAHPSALELSKRHPPSAAGAVSQEGLRLVEAMGVSPADALELYRSLSWTVTGFVYMEQALVHSVHHHRVSDTRWVLDISDGEDDTGASPSEFDTDALFTTTLGLALDGVEQRVRV
ncbi:MAG: TetR/AcrR family transcriptional regulator [Acidimicrobiia bacterium]